MRIFTAIAWFFKILFKGKKAFLNAPLPDGEVPPTFSGSSEPAIQLLGLFQKEGRLIDFLMENMDQYSDADIGAAARDIHNGCRKVLQERVVLNRVLEEEENSSITVPAEFDPSKIEIQGNVSEGTEVNGTVIHRGWYAEEIKLPTVPEKADPKVVAPAQVEVA